MRSVTKVLSSRIMIKKLEEDTIIGESSIIIKDDGESLPTAEVILVADDIDRVSVGDIIHYVEGRETGKCYHNGIEHFIIPVSNAVAIL